MSLKLLKVTLENIRSHEYLEYTPGDEGVSVIQGANGTGKSTIIDSIAWAIYATKPPSVRTNAMLIRDGVDLKDKDQKVSATVDLEVDGQHTRVQRRIMTNAGGTEADVWLVNPSQEKIDAILSAAAATDSDDTEDGDDNTVSKLSTDEEGNTLLHLVGSSATNAKNYMVKYLRMDEKGFLSSVMVQQKQVDSLIAARPAERADIIEKLTGISALTKAMEFARDEHNSLKKQAKNSTADESELTKQVKEQERVQKNVEKMQKQHARLEERYTKKITAARELRDTLNEQEAAFQNAQALHTELTQVVTRRESAVEELQPLEEDRKSKREQLQGLPKDSSLDDVEREHNDLTKRLRTAQNNADNAKQRAETVTAQITDLQAVIGDQQADQVSKELETKNTENAAQSKVLQELKTAISGRTQDSQRIQKAIDVLEKGHGSCPTCLQEVDDVTDAVNSLEDQIAENTTKNASDEKRVEQIEHQIDTLQQEIDTLSNVAEAFGKLKQAEQDLKQHNADHAEYGSDAKILEQEHKTSERKLYHARNHAETNAEYQRLLKRSQAVLKTIEDAERREAQIQEELKDLKVVKQDQLTKRREEVDAAREEVSDLKNDITQKRGEIRVDEERANSLSKDIARLEAEVAKHKELLERVELAATSQKLVEDFRTARIESAIPVIEVYASDLISSFTDGHFIGVELDAKFNMTVTLADGTSRPVGLLSGGELSAASIALRLAISMMLTGGSSQQLIILDEVLVSQDLSRAEKILSTIKEVSKGQVILIAHSEIVEFVADDTFDMGTVAQT